MKKSLLVFVIILIFVSFLVSVEVNSTTASNIADFHWTIFSGSNAKLVAIDPIKSPKGTVLAYVASYSPKGFVVVSADTDFYPILAYSFSDKFSFDNIPQNALLQIIKKDVENMISNKSKINTTKNNTLWTKYQNKDKNYFTANIMKHWPPKNASKTGGWLNTLWTETKPYNSKCPKDPNTGIRTNAGSVSVTLAQIFNYFHYLPSISFNSADAYQTLNGIDIDKDARKYDFPSFSNLNSNLATIKNKLASNIPLSDTDAAYLIFACGIAVNMHFSSETPDSWTWDVLNATKNKFKYKSAKMYYTDDDSFFVHLKNNLKNRLPVALDFDDKYEHIIACDGFNNGDFYHLNIGWNEKVKNSMTVWYHINTENLPIISQAIMYFRNSYTVPTSAIKKIELPSDIVNETLIDEETTTTETKSKKNIKEDLIEDVIEEDVVQTPKQTRQTFYEEPPVVIKQVPPRYPRLMKKAGIEGTVLLFVEIKSDGTVGDIEVKKSLNSGKGGLDEAAIKAVKKWKFEPAKNAGKPITVWVNLPIVFSLH